jgi:hypothetical protein
MTEAFPTIDVTALLDPVASPARVGGDQPAAVDRHVFHSKL